MHEESGPKTKSVVVLVFHALCCNGRKLCRLRGRSPSTAEDVADQAKTNAAPLSVSYAKIVRGEFQSTSGPLDGLTCLFVNESDKGILDFKFTCVTFDAKGNQISCEKGYGYAFLPYEASGDPIEIGAEGGERAIDLDAPSDYQYEPVPPDSSIHESVAFWNTSVRVESIFIFLTSVSFDDGLVWALSEDEIAVQISMAKLIDYTSEHYVELIKQRAQQSNTDLPVTITTDSGSGKTTIQNNTDKEISIAYVVYYPGGGDYLYESSVQDENDWFYKSVNEIRIRYVTFTDGTYWFNPLL